MQYSPVSRGGDEVQAAVHSVVRHLPSVDPRLCVEVILKLTVDVVDHRLPAATGKKEMDSCKLLIRNRKAVESMNRHDDTPGAYQLLLSTASPNPGVSTMVSSSCTPPSFTSTLDCSTWTQTAGGVYAQNKTASTLGVHTTPSL